MSDDDKAGGFEQRTKRMFDDSVAGLDGTTRSRLTQARYRALEGLTPRRDRGWRWSVVPVGTLAATALVVWLTVWQAPPTATDVQTAPLADLEILLDEELEFYGWLEEQPEFAAAGDSVG
jgi:hypothetical protein